MIFLWRIEVRTSGSSTSNPVGLQNRLEITLAQRFSLVSLSKMDTILANCDLSHKNHSEVTHWDISWSIIYLSKNSENGLKWDTLPFPPPFAEPGKHPVFVITKTINQRITILTIRGNKIRHAFSNTVNSKRISGNQRYCIRIFVVKNQ